jgi:hypothetical protein
MEAEQGSIIKFFVEENMKWVEVIDRLNQYDDRDAVQRMRVYYWIKEVKSRRMDLSTMSPPGRASDEGLDNGIGKALNENPSLSVRKTAKALNIGSTTVRSHFTKSLG